MTSRGNSKKKLNGHAAGLEPAQIKCELEMRGLTLKQVATDAGYHPTSGSRVLRQPWPAMERVLADALGMEPDEVWPSRYDGNGYPLIYAQPRTRKRTVSRSKRPTGKVKQ